MIAASQVQQPLPYHSPYRQGANEHRPKNRALTKLLAVTLRNPSSPHASVASPWRTAGKGPLSRSAARYRWLTILLHLQRSHFAVQTDLVAIFPPSVEFELIFFSQRLIQRSEYPHNQPGTHCSAHFPTLMKGGLWHYFGSKNFLRRLSIQIDYQRFCHPLQPPACHNPVELTQCALTIRSSGRN